MTSQIHEVEKNFIRMGVASLNHANIAGLDDVLVASVSPATIATLRTAVEGIATAHSTTKDFLLRHSSQMLQKLNDLTRPMATPVAPSGGNLTTATSGGSLLDNTTYYFKVTAVDIFGNESLPSAQVSKATGAAATADDNLIVLKNMAAIDGAVSYRLYPSLTTGVFTSGYVSVTVAAIEGSTGYSFLTMSGLTANTIPTVNNAFTSALSYTEIVDAIGVGTFASLLSKVTAEDSTVDTALDRSFYVVK